MINHLKKITGFTLIELMIVVAILAIIAAIVYPSYLDSVRKARRADAQVTLIDYTALAELIFTETNSYAGATKARTGLVDSAFYTFTPVVTATSYTVTAAAQGDQVNDTCGSMSINNIGEATPSTAGCW